MPLRHMPPSRTMLWMAMLSPAVGGGCALEAREDAYARALPDERVLIDMPAATGASRSAAGDPSEMAGFTGQVTGDVNALIQTVLSTIDTVVSYPPTWTDGEETALWGPWEDAGLLYALWVTHDADEGLYSWGINTKLASEGDADYVTIVAGQTGDDATEDQYRGWFVVDFSAIGEKNPAEATRGTFASTFTVQGSDVEAEAAFGDFRDAATPEGAGVDALYRYAQTVGAEGLMDLVFLDDATGAGQAEYHVVRSRWSPHSEGRADVYLTGGDLGPLVFSATECWDRSHRVTFYENNYDLSRSGEESDCVFLEPSFNEADAAALSR